MLWSAGIFSVFGPGLLSSSIGAISRKNFEYFFLNSETVGRGAMPDSRFCIDIMTEVTRDIA